MAKILHTADWHLRNGQYGSRRRGEDFTKAAKAVVDIAIKEEVHAICNCGDTLNTRYPSSLNIDDLVTIDEMLMEAGIPMYCISGNHDAANPAWISLVHGHEAPEAPKMAGIIDIDRKQVTVPGTNITVYGHPSVGANAFREDARSFPQVDILMSHEPLKEFAAFPMPDGSLSAEDFPRVAQAVLLGDLHSCQYKPVSGFSIFGYPGSIELCSQNEPLAKTVTIFDTDNWNPVPHPVPTRDAVFYRITHEQELQQALADLDKHIDNEPIVLVRHVPELPTTSAAFMTACAGKNAILRCAAMPSASAKMLFDRHSPDDLKQPADFAGDFVPAGTPIHALAVKCANPDEDPRVAIEEYVAARLGDDSF